MLHISKDKSNLGFSIMELLVVLVIISILATVAVPAYRSYIVRAKITEAMSVVESWKIKVSGYYADNEKLPLTCGTAVGPLADVTSPAPTVAKIMWCNTNNAIAATFSPSVGTELANKEIWLQASLSSDFIKWTCGTSTDVSKQIACKYLPDSCKQNCTP